VLHMFGNLRMRVLPPVLAVQLGLGDQVEVEELTASDWQVGTLAQHYAEPLQQAALTHVRHRKSPCHAHVWSMLQVLYVEGGLVHCLHPTTFEQTAIPEVRRWSMCSLG
jgi:hypothetical protein